MQRRHHGKEIGRLGEVTATQHRITLEPDTRPSRQPPYRAGHSSRVLIKHEIERMLSDCFIEPAMSEWASSVVIVLKKTDRRDSALTTKSSREYNPKRVPDSEDGRLHRLARGRQRPTL